MVREVRTLWRQRRKATIVPILGSWNLKLHLKGEGKQKQNPGQTIKEAQRKRPLTLSLFIFLTLLFFLTVLFSLLKRRCSDDFMFQRREFILENVNKEAI